MRSSEMSGSLAGRSLTATPSFSACTLRSSSMRLMFSGVNCRQNGGGFGKVEASAFCDGSSGLSAMAKSCNAVG